ncbi:hypothetical protein ABZ858_09720 [Streptomyces sp. NPDC047017]|uniref:hypothetical protein n=1 Tax=Streptomyces sp. NPDC047017 TaxID=3155024 RepID=UPI003403239E
MRYRDDVRPDTAGTPGQRPAPVVSDRRWAREVRTSARCAVALLGLLLLIDWGTGGLTWWRGLLWSGLAGLLLLVLWPPRVSAGEGWLAIRSPLRRRRVRTDLLESVRVTDGVCRRLVLRDALGARVEIDPQVLLDNPALWYRFEEDARRSATSGRPHCGTGALRDLAELVDRETALALFRISGLEP